MRIRTNVVTEDRLDIIVSTLGKEIWPAQCDVADTLCVAWLGHFSNFYRKPPLECVPRSGFSDGEDECVQAFPGNLHSNTQKNEGNHP
jgi:hypothetical protein